MTAAGAAGQRAERWLRRIRESRHTLWLMGTLSFLETIIVPVPMELVLVPLMVIDRDKIWKLAHAVLAGCLAASLLGYGIGVALYESVGTWFIETMGYQQAYQSFQQFFDNHGFLAILVVGVLPIPFQVAMITAGLSGYPVHLFVLAAVLARGIRYYGLAWLAQRFGARAQELWKRNALAAGLGAAVVVVVISFVTQEIARRVI